MNLTKTHNLDGYYRNALTTGLLERPDHYDDDDDNDDDDDDDDDDCDVILFLPYVELAAGIDNRDVYVSVPFSYLYVVSRAPSVR